MSAGGALSVNASPMQLLKRYPHKLSTSALTRQSMRVQDAAAAAPAAGGMGASAYGNDVGNDGLTQPQRQVKAVMDSERHQTNPDGLTVEQVHMA